MPEDALMRADQILDVRNGSPVTVRSVGRLKFEAHPPHFHWHLQPFVRYELRDPKTYALIGNDRKTGFCLVDRYGHSSKKVPSRTLPRFIDNCQKENRRALTVDEGSSPGYVDRYPAFFHGQDIDITDVPPGRYVLAQVANPNRTLRERRFTNDAASLLIELRPPVRNGGLPSVTVIRRCPETATCPPA